MVFEEKIINGLYGNGLFKRHALLINITWRLEHLGEIGILQGEICWPFDDDYSPSKCIKHCAAL